MVNRFDVWLVSPDPTQSHEIRKTRPCVIVSPDEVNGYLKTVTIAPMTSKSFEVPTRVGIVFDGKKGRIVLDQIRTVDRNRLLKCFGSLDKNTSSEVLAILQSLFANSLSIRFWSVLVSPGQF